MEYYVGQRWETSQKFYPEKRQLKILAIADKHIMCRYKSCIPFVRSIKEFPKYLESIQAVEINIKNK